MDFSNREVETHVKKSRDFAKFASAGLTCFKQDQTLN